MNIDIFENVFMLLVAIATLMLSLSRFISMPRRGLLYVTAFFLCNILSDYYWTVYILVMRQEPEVSGFMANFGWNLGFLVLLVLVIHMRSPESRRYFHPLMLLPIPLNIWQFTIYYPFGGLANNLWQVGLTTCSACICLQALLYYLKKRKEGACFPYTHLFVLIFLTLEYGQWTSSCFSWPSPSLNPYYYFAFAGYILMLFFSWAVEKDYFAKGLPRHEKTAEEIRFHTVLQILATSIILGGCTGGYFLALWMKNMLLAENSGTKAYSLVAMMLFVISIFVVALILAVMLVVGYRYRNSEHKHKEIEAVQKNKFNFLVTVFITFGLMVFSVVFTSRILYRVSVTGIYSTGEDAADAMATRLQAYLSDARSILQVSSDTVDLMLQKEESEEKILDFLKYQTVTQQKLFDENFTGLYSVCRGEYLDGSGWIPPEDYEPTERDWYNEAVKAGGKVVIVPPYVDAQTHSIVITICRLIADTAEQEAYHSKNVMALDVIVNHLQEITEKEDVGGKGFAFVVNDDGLIVTHKDPSLAGENAKDIYGHELLEKLKETGSGTMQVPLNEEESTLFVSRLLDQWYVVLAVSDSELMEDVHMQLTVSILVSLVIFALISLFYSLAYRNEQVHEKQLEEMRTDQRRREYEAEVLKLEKKSADEANRAKSSFLADMSHEIRTPINAILGMDEMILRDPKGDHVQEYAKNISVSGRNLLSLVNSILDFSKIEDGKMEIVPVSYNLKSMITYLINSVSERARAKELALLTEVDPNLPSELYGDDARISQVIMNLLTNAVKYTPEGSVLFIVREKERVDDRVLLYFEVRDTGIGIRESDMEKLFESFERLDVVKNRTIEGTGLGMSIVTKLLRLMESELKVESVYGEGSSFSFTLWQKIESEEPVGDYHIDTSEDMITDTGAGLLYAPAARILITDDTKMNIVVAVSLLSSTGIQIDTAGSGDEAIALARETPYDLILMDQRMPGIDGTETMKRIHELEQSPNRETPVICLTADAIRGAREKYMAEGFTDYLTKPVNGYALEQMLLNYLPKDKIMEHRPESAAEEHRKPGKDEETLCEVLKKAGINTDVGLKHSQNDFEIYRLVLTEYARDGKKRIEDLKRMYSDQAWDDYLIYAHSLKSTSRTIGAEELSELAAGLERAAKEREISVIRRDHAQTMEMYQGVIDVLWREIGIVESEMEAAEDFDVLEFEPEG